MAATLCCAPRAPPAQPAAAAGTAFRPLSRPLAPAHRRRSSRSAGPHIAAAALPPGLEGLPAATAAAAATSSNTSGLLGGVQTAVHNHAALYVFELLLAGAAAYAAAVWPTRPRGWVFKELVQVGPSRVAGRGVFAIVHIEAGTVLGAYPGRPRTPAEMAAKAAAAPGAKDYAFKTRDGRMLDPTDASGLPSSAPAPGLPWLPIDVSLAFVNEPPKGSGGTNVSVEDDPSDPAGLLCVAARAIYPGEELFMDYGLTYDRSGYAAAQQAGQGGKKADEDRAGAPASGEGGARRAEASGTAGEAVQSSGSGSALALAAALGEWNGEERRPSDMEPRCSY